MINKRANEQQKAERTKSGGTGGNREKSKIPPRANNNDRGAPLAVADPAKKLIQDEVRILFQKGAASYAAKMVIPRRTVRRSWLVLAILIAKLV